jgi:hypothetical protein
MTRVTPSGADSAHFPRVPHNQSQTQLGSEGTLMRKLPALILGAVLPISLAACGGAEEPAAPAASSAPTCDKLPSEQVKAIASGFAKKGGKIESASVAPLPAHVQKFNLKRVVAVSVKGEPAPAVLAMGAERGPIWAIDANAKRLFEWGAMIERNSPAWKAQLLIEMSREAREVAACES